MDKNNRPGEPGEEEERELGEARRVREEKLSALRREGEDPFLLTTYDKDTEAADVTAGFDRLEGKTVSVAGRVMSKRGMGKASFFDVQDGSGRLQIYVRIDDVGPDAYAAFKKWDIGDIVGVRGFVFRTKRGAVTLHAKSLTLLSKSLLPLPEKWHGLKDTEIRYRRRYLDLIMNPDVRRTFVLRSRIISAVRSFLDGRGFLEVETPVLNTIPGGAAARPFITHHNALDIDLYLRIATELYLKRLVVGGFERVYELAKDFRNEGIDVRHNPEFTMLELYQAYTDYNGMMELTETMVSEIAEKVLGSGTVPCQGAEIKLAPPWKRITMADAVRQFAGVDFQSFRGDDEKARAAAGNAGLEGAEKKSWGEILAQFFDERVEEKLVQPTFVLDYPVEVSPLTKRRRDDPELTERFEFFIAGREMGNAYSELNDPIDQRERFERQARLRESGDDEAQRMDEDFLTAMEYGMPPTGGLGIGIDRLVMLLTDSYSIRDVLLFPTMRPKD